MRGGLFGSFVLVEDVYFLRYLLCIKSVDGSRMVTEFTASVVGLVVFRMFVLYCAYTCVLSARMTMESNRRDHGSQESFRSNYSFPLLRDKLDP